MAALGSLLSGIQRNTLFQIAEYQVAGALLGGVLEPEADALRQTVYDANPIAILSPADAAEAVLRNVWPAGRARAEAQRSGVNSERFDVLSRLAGNAPDPQSLAVALRRKLIGPDRYLEGIRQGRLRDEWAELVQQLSVQEPTPGDALDALLEGQLPEGRARDLYAQFGGDPAHFQWLFDSRGSAPTPSQAADMANRGIISWSGSGPRSTSFEQAFLEGPWRNKWLGPFRKAAEYFPPPRTITAMYNEGSLSRARAMELLKAQGLADDLAAAYLSSGSSQKTAPTKDLARGTIETLYRDRLVTRDNAASFLESLGYSGDEAGFILAVVDVAVVQRFLSAAVGRIHTLYVGHKVSREASLSALAALDVPAETLPDLIGIWDLERAANVRVLSPAEIASAYKLSLIDQASAQAMLQQLGYQPHDAWLYLSIHVKSAQPDEPPAGAVNPGPGPVGG
jgi:hypothetical protein